MEAVFGLRDRFPMPNNQVDDLGVLRVLEELLEMQP